jgi:hypothetical protein
MKKRPKKFLGVCASCLKLVPIRETMKDVYRCYLCVPERKESKS